MNKEVLQMIQAQINKELYSAYLYLAMANWFSQNTYTGFETWMRTQVKEELSHAAHMMNYIQDRGESVDLQAIAKPEGNWKTPLEVFQAAYAHEKFVTKSITDIFVKARETIDINSENFLQWFITEQLEEETTASTIVGRLKIAGDSSEAILMLDKEYGTRTFTMNANITF
ncbi:MAG: ferritin [Spirochaetales bacterium]